MTGNLSLLIVFAALLTGCSSAPKFDRSQINAVGDSIARTICADQIPQIERIANQHVDGVIDRIETRSCPAGRSTVYLSQVASDPTGLPMEALVHSKRAGLPAFIEIGTPISAALQVLGPPDSQDSRTLTYELSTEVPDTLTIEQMRGLVSAVRWSWYLD